jgi:hypothetical protein
MDNASKNAKDMIGSLQMKYNCGRQAAITNELVDIITGMFDFLFRHLPTSTLSTLTIVESGFFFTKLYRCQCSLSPYN